MAFPFLSECNFEAGNMGHFDVETDTETRLDFPHYSQLAQIPGLAMPYRGAYCMRVNLANDGTPADAYVQETGSWDLAASGSIFFKFRFWVDPLITMANADEFAILQLWSGASTAEGGIYVNFTTANGLRLGIGELAAAQFLPLRTNAWNVVEAKFVIDSGVGNDGTIDAWLNGSAFTQVTALDQAAITSGVFGVVGQDVGTTKGYLLFDDIVADDARLFDSTIRFPVEQFHTISSHAFVGPGCLEDVELLSGGATDNVLTIYDTDTANTHGNPVCELKNTVNNEMVQNLRDVYVQRGAYINLAGTNPRAIVRVRPRVAFGSDGAIRNYGQRRIARPEL